MKITEISQILAESPLFSGMKVPQIVDLMNQCSFNLVKFKKSQTILHRGQEIEAMIILLEGSVRGEMIDYSGKVLQIETIHPPRPLAPAFMFSKTRTYPVDVIAENHGQYLSIPRPNWLTLIQNHQVLLTTFLNIISQRTHFLSEKVYFMSFKTIRQKYLQYVLSQSRSRNNPFQIPFNQQSLSEFFGVTRPSLSRTISQLRREGIVDHSGKSVHILNRQKLLDQLDED